MSELSEVRAAVGDALADAFTKSDYMVTRWVVGAEVINADGERWIWNICPEGQRAWDSLGIIRFMDHLEAGGIVRDAIKEDE